jgi:hypothetical protein
MFTHHLESATIGADSLTLDEISRACWKGFEEGIISEADAAAISEAVQARRIAEAADPCPAQTSRAALAESGGFA